MDAVPEGVSRLIVISAVIFSQLGAVDGCDVRDRAIGIEGSAIDLEAALVASNGAHVGDYATGIEFCAVDGEAIIIAGNGAHVGHIAAIDGHAADGSAGACCILDLGGLPIQCVDAIDSAFDFLYGGGVASVVGDIVGDFDIGGVHVGSVDGGSPYGGHAGQCRALIVEVLGLGCQFCDGFCIASDAGTYPIQFTVQSDQVIGHSIICINLVDSLAAINGADSLVYARDSIVQLLYVVGKALVGIDVCF